MGVVTSSEDARTTDAGATAASDAAPSNAERRDVDDDVAFRSLSFDESDAVARGRMDRDLRSSRARETDRDAPMRTVGARPASDDMCIAARHTDRARATLCWIAWKVHCGVARCMPSFERSPADRGVGDLPHLPKVPTGRARQKYLSELTRKQTTSRSAGSSRHSRPRGRVIASGSPPTPLPASTASHVAARIHAFDHPVRTGPRTTPDAAGFFGSKQQQDVHQE